jgi:poly(3-hydroxybutyrate) depolymerase
VLGHIYGQLAPPSEANGELLHFDQREFVDTKRTHGLAEAGYVYVPERCAKGERCRLHAALHGCGQAAESIGDVFARHAGYDGWAEANAIVILYPQAATLTKSVGGVRMDWPNPQGCWDWWGFTGEDFAYRTGAQIRAVIAMIDRLTGKNSDKSRKPEPACD